MRSGAALGTRWLGVGLATALAVVTLGLWATGRLGLYINPDAAWWAVSMSVVCVVGAIWSSAVPISHSVPHDHDHDSMTSHPAVAQASSSGAPVAAEASRRGLPALIATGVGALLASGFVALAVVLPPASLSAELALARSGGAAPMLATSATLTLATSDDTSGFGVGEWASVLATTTDPARFVGERATLTGFVGPDREGAGFDLTRLVIVHCVIDAQAAQLPVADLVGESDLSPGEWVTVEGEFVRAAGGALVLEASSVTPVAEPGDPYEY